MNKIFFTYRSYSYILFSILFSSSAFALSFIDGLGLTSAQKKEARSMVSGINNGEGINNEEKILFKESKQENKGNTNKEYKFTKIERLLNGENIEESLIGPKILKQFGYDIFSEVPTTFAPITNIPIPNNYVIGPGDVINIFFFGSKNLKYSKKVNREGFLNITGLGPISVSGLTFSELKDDISNRVSTQMVDVKASVSLSKLRSIRIFVLGEVKVPGSYIISSLSTLTNAIFASGGISRIGTMRDIQLKRKGKIITHFDLYDLFLRGDTSSDHKLLPGDVIFVPPIGPTVGVSGEVRRPAIYEMKKDKADLLSIITAAGGTSANANTTKIFVKSANDVGDVTAYKINLTTKDGKEHQIKNGDLVVISPKIGHTKEGFITITGEVKNPGMYVISQGDTLLSAIKRAGGFTNQAHIKGAVFTRKSLRILEDKRKREALQNLERRKLLEAQPSAGVSTDFSSLKQFIAKLRDLPSLGRMVVSMESIASGEVEDVVLVHGDTLSIPAISQEVTVMGEVFHPTSHLFNGNYDIDDYVGRSGGLKKSGDYSSVYVIKANGSVVTKNNLGGSFFRNNNNIASINVGDTIVVPINTDTSTTEEDWLMYTSLASQVAITIVSFKSLGLF
jgi:protein involved in polysaccharide export with SLBB domain